MCLIDLTDISKAFSVMKTNFEYQRGIFGINSIFVEAIFQAHE